MTSTKTSGCSAARSRTGRSRTQALVALRSQFRYLHTQRRIFRNPPPG